MSLVREALRKAEREAARRRMAELGLQEPMGYGVQPFRKKGARFGRWALGALAAAGLGLALLGGYLFWKSEKTASLSLNTGSAFEPLARSTPTPTLSPPPAGSPPASSKFQSTGNLHPQPTPPSLPKVAGVRNAVSASPETPPSSSAEAQTRTEARPEPASSGQSASSSATYLKEAVLPHGEVLRLGGIAWSEAAPLAYLNGRLLAKGEEVLGWTIVDIQREEVELARGAERIRLKLR